MLDNGFNIDTLHIDSVLVIALTTLTKPLLSIGRIYCQDQEYPLYTLVKTDNYYYS